MDGSSTLPVSAGTKVVTRRRVLHLLAVAIAATQLPALTGPVSPMPAAAAAAALPAPPAYGAIVGLI